MFSSSKKKETKDWIVWQDREIKFDAKKQFMAMDKNEKVVQRMNQIEDSKGN